MRSFSLRKILSGAILLAGIALTHVLAIELPPTEHEYSWLERQEINFENQKLLVELEPLIASKDWPEAEKVLSKAIENDPYSNALKGRMLTVLAESGQYAKGLEWAYPLLEKYPRYTPLVLYIGNLETSLGNSDTAAKAWTYILALPNSSDDDRLYAAKSLYYYSLATGNLPTALESARTWARLERSYPSYLQYASAL
ncbi:MAG: tetratricopeptide repeat protein, partial [Puniceicoccales bacterium]